MDPGLRVVLLGFVCAALVEGCSERPAVANDPAQLALGANLEGQPNWRERLVEGHSQRALTTATTGQTLNFGKGNSS